MIYAQLIALVIMFSMVIYDLVSKKPIDKFNYLIMSIFALYYAVPDMIARFNG